MSNKCVLYYKICIENAGLTQEEASRLLDVCTRTLSAYENGENKNPIPDEIVDQMAQIYNTPKLAHWHLKNTNCLGKYLPDYVMPQTHGDMVFQLVLAYDQLEIPVTYIKKIMADGIIEEHELKDLEICIKNAKEISGKLLAISIYGEDIIRNFKKEKATASDSNFFKSF